MTELPQLLVYSNCKAIKLFHRAIRLKLYTDYYTVLVIITNFIGQNVKTVYFTDYVSLNCLFYKQYYNC